MHLNWYQYILPFTATILVVGIQRVKALEIEISMPLNLVLSSNTILY